MKRKIRKFQLMIHCDSEEGFFSNINTTFKGVVIVDLLQPVEIRSIMIGRSTSFHCSGLTSDRTRIGKQIYVESVKTLFGDEDCQRAVLHDAGLHSYRFEVRDNLPEDATDEESSARLSWTNLKAVIINDKGKTIFSDVIIQNAVSESLNANVPSEIPIKLSDEKIKFLKVSEHQPNRIRIHSLSQTRNKKRSSKSSASKEDHSALLDADGQGIPINVDYQKSAKNDRSECNDIEIRCRLKKTFFKIDEPVFFVVQCENNTKKGYKHIMASLIERSPIQTNAVKSKKRRSKPVVTASIVGPPVGPKEMVVWEGFLSPTVSSECNECWYTLRIEADTKLRTKEQMEIPVVIMDDPRTPTLKDELATDL